MVPIVLVVLVVYIIVLLVTGILSLHCRCVGEGTGNVQPARIYGKCSFWVL